MSGRVNAAVARDIEELREATRELHEAIKDARTTRRDLEAYVADVRKEFAVAFSDRAAAMIVEGLTAYQTSLDEAIERATQSVFARFDALSDILRGADKKNRRKGGRTLEEMVGGGTT